MGCNGYYYIFEPLKETPNKIDEIYDDNNLFNKIRNYIKNYSSLTSKIKMLRRTLLYTKKLNVSLS